MILGYNAIGIYNYMVKAGLLSLISCMQKLNNFGLSELIKELYGLTRNGKLPYLIDIMNYDITNVLNV